MFISDKGDLKSSLENLLDNKSRFYLSKIQRINMLEKLVELFKKYALQNQNPEVIDLCEFIKYSINKYKLWTSNLKEARLPKRDCLPHTIIKYSFHAFLFLGIIISLWKL